MVDPHRRSLPIPVRCSVMSATTTGPGHQKEGAGKGRHEPAADPASPSPTLLLAKPAPPAIAEQIRYAVPACHRLTRAARLVGQEAIAEIWIIVVSVEQGICPVRLRQLRDLDWLANSPAAGLSG